MRFKIPKLSDQQIRRLADITSDLGTLFVAAVVLPVILSNFKILSFILGSLLAVFFWISSLWLETLTKSLNP